MSDNLLGADDLVNNPIPRVPVCLCLDVSGSMAGKPIKELNRGVRMFYDTIQENEVALYSAEVCIVTFGEHGAKCVSDFSNLKQQPDAPKLEANGYTPMGEAVNLGLDRLANRKTAYKRTGVDYFQPWLVLMTDGKPNGDSDEFDRAIQRTTEMVNVGKLSVFPIGIGKAADMDALALFSPKRTPLKLQGLKFREFFEWLSQSVSRTSQSLPGEAIPLDLEGVKGWAEL